MADAGRAASGHRGRRRRRDRGPGDRPERIGGLVGSLLARWGIADRVERASVIAEWDAIVGPHIARVATPVRIDGETLFVEVVSAAWRTELGLMRPDLMRKINAGKRAGRIEKIVFLQAGGRRPEERNGRVER